MRRSIVLIFLLASLTGCATSSDFYGIRINDFTKLNDFQITSYTQEGVRYTLDRKHMDGGLTAFGSISLSTLTITVSNKSDQPIKTSYFGDTFTLLTVDGKEYKLTKGHVTSYPRVEYVNPGSSAYFSLGLPAAIVPLDKNDVKVIICQLGAIQKTTIVLRPLPDKTPQQ